MNTYHRTARNVLTALATLFVVGCTSLDATVRPDLDITSAWAEDEALLRCVGAQFSGSPVLNTVLAIGPIEDATQKESPFSGRELPLNVSGAVTPMLQEIGFGNLINVSNFTPMKYLQNIGKMTGKMPAVAYKPGDLYIVGTVISYDVAPVSGSFDFVLGPFGLSDREFDHRFTIAIEILGPSQQVIASSAQRGVTRTRELRARGSGSVEDVSGALMMGIRTSPRLGEAIMKTASLGIIDALARASGVVWEPCMAKDAEGIRHDWPENVEFPHAQASTTGTVRAISWARRERPSQDRYAYH